MGSQPAGATGGCAGPGIEGTAGAGSETAVGDPERYCLMIAEIGVD